MVVKSRCRRLDHRRRRMVAAEEQDGAASFYGCTTNTVACQGAKISSRLALHDPLLRIGARHEKYVT